MELRKCSIMVLVRLIKEHPTIVFVLVQQDEITFSRLVQGEENWCSCKTSYYDSAYGLSYIGGSKFWGRNICKEGRM